MSGFPGAPKRFAEAAAGPQKEHLREEMILVREGTVELTVAGKPYRLGPGDVGVIGSNETHNAKNVGASLARYFILNIGRDDI